MKKRRHHYVWKKYLKAWATNDKIWCFRNGAIFNPNVNNIAVEGDFYKIKTLTNSEIDLVKKMSLGIHEGIFDHLFKGWIHLLKAISDLQNDFDSKTIKSESFKLSYDELVYNIEENLYADIEKIGLKYLDLLYREDIRFFESDFERNEFAYFLGAQFLRTKLSQNNVTSSLKFSEARLNINIENCWSILRNIYAVNIGFSIANDLEFKVVLLKNSTVIPFITGDQPVMNTKAVNILGLRPPKETEFYYPISPRLAILITKDIWASFKSGSITEPKDVLRLNRLIEKVSHEQLYSNVKWVLENTSSENFLKNIANRSTRLYPHKKRTGKASEFNRYVSSQFGEIG